MLSVVLSPDGKHIVSSSFDDIICLCDAKTDDAISKPLERHSDFALSVAFSPDGKYIVSGSLNNTIHTWDVQMEFPTISGFINNSQLFLSGWVVNSYSEKLFLVPPWNQPGLCWPTNNIVISCEKVSTKLDMSKFVHGMAWQECWTH